MRALRILMPARNHLPCSTPFPLPCSHNRKGCSSQGLWIEAPCSPRSAPWKTNKVPDADNLRTRSSRIPGSVPCRNRAHKSCRLFRPGLPRPSWKVRYAAARHRFRRTRKEARPLCCTRRCNPSGMRQICCHGYRLQPLPGHPRMHRLHRSC